MSTEDPGGALSSSSSDAASSNRAIFWLAAILTIIGGLSDGSQRLFAVSYVFGIDDVSDELQHPNGPEHTLALTYLMLGALAICVASCGLEEGFTRDFVKGCAKTLGCHAGTEETENVKDPERADPSNDPRSQEAIDSVTLSNGAYVGVAVVAISAAIARCVSSIMGFYTIYNSVDPAFLTPVIVCSSIDGIQTIATDGQFFADFCLISSLLARSWWNPDRYSLVDSHQSVRLIDGEDDRHTPQGEWLHNSMLFVNAIAIISDVGTAKLSIDEFSDLFGIDSLNPFFIAGEALSLTSLFLLMYAIDARTLANKIAAHFYPSQANTASSWPQCSSWGLFMGAAAITLLGASMSTLSAYTGTRYLLQTWFPNLTDIPLNCISGGIATLKLSQFMAVEACYTMDMLLTMKLPSCSAMCASLGSLTCYHRLNSSDSSESSNQLSKKLITTTNSVDPL